MANYTDPAGVRETGRSSDKVDIIKDAYSQLRISGLTVEPTPDDLELALIRLEDMAAQWEAKNLTVGYNYEQEPDPNSPSGVQPGYKLAFSQNLALYLVPDFNKIPPTLEKLANGSFNSMQSQVALARLQQVQYPARMARGSGNTLRFNRWNRFYRTRNEFGNTTNTIQIFIGDIEDYSFNFDSYLRDGETIKSYDLQLDTGLRLIDDSLDGSENSVLFTVEAQNPNDVTPTQFGAQVTCIITTSDDRVSTRRLFYTLVPRKLNNEFSTVSAN